MGRMVSGILVLVLGLSVMAGEEGRDKPATPAEQYEALDREFREAAHEYFVEATTDADRGEPLARIIKLSPRCLELAERYSKNPIALDALVHVVVLSEAPVRQPASVDQR